MYSLAILACFISPFAHALSNIFDAFVAGKLFSKPSTVIFYANLTGVIGFVALPLIGNINPIPSHLLPVLIAISLIEFLYLFPYYMALKLIDTSIVAALFSLNRIIIPFLAYFLVGEVLSPSQYLGFAIVLISSIALNLESPKKLKINKGFWLMLITAFILSINSVFYKKILLEVDWVSTAFWSLLITFFLRNTIVLIPKFRKDIVESFPKYKKNFSKFLFIEMFDQVGVMTPIFALSIVPVLVQKSIASTQSIFVLIWGFLLYKLFGDKFKESFSRKDIIKKLICFAFIVLGVNFVIKAF